MDDSTKSKKYDESEQQNSQEDNLITEEQLKKKEEDERKKLLNADVLSSLLLLILSLYVSFEGIRIILFEDTGTDVWYYSPGFYPLFVGSVLIILSVLLLDKSFKSGGKLKLHLEKIKSTNFRFANPSTRVIIAVALLLVYVFVLIGRLPFIVSTFIYLASTMIIFRDGKIAIWKLIAISAVVASAIFSFFHFVARIPLP